MNRVIRQAMRGYAAIQGADADSMTHLNERTPQWITRPARHFVQRFSCGSSRSFRRLWQTAFCEFHRQSSNLSPCLPPRNCLCFELCIRDVLQPRHRWLQKEVRRSGPKSDTAPTLGSSTTVGRPKRRATVQNCSVIAFSQSAHHDPERHN